MPVLKSETRIKQIDTTSSATGVSEYASGDVVYDQADGLVRHNGTEFEGVQVGKGLFIKTGIAESIVTVNPSSVSDTNYDCQLGQIFHGTPYSEDWRVNLINFALSDNSGTNITIIVAQDGSPQIPSSITISSTDTRSGTTTTIKWMDNQAPTPTANGIDVFSFTIFKLSDSEVVLGQMVPFGG